MPPIVCHSCNHSNDPWRKHCGGCGGALPGSCRSCGAVNRPDDRFCGGCAHPLRATRPVAAQKPPFASTMPIDISDVIAEARVEAIEGREADDSPS
jgi:hypothetical protein